MSSFFAGLASVAGFSNGVAVARSISTGAERSLLYWRYLCENSPQIETVQDGWRELSCPSQGWKVKSKVNEDVVKEVSEKDSTNE